MFLERSKTTVFLGTGGGRASRKLHIPFHSVGGSLRLSQADRAKQLELFIRTTSGQDGS